MQENMACSLEKATTAEDISVIEGLAAIVWREHYTPIIGEEQVRYMIGKFQNAEAMTRQIDEGYLYFFIRKNGESVGYTALQFADGRCFLSKLYILQEYRGGGCGTAVLSQILEMCREQSAGRIRLTVNRHNESSIAAYKKMGFRVIEEKCADIGGGYFMDDYIMEKKVGEGT